MQEIPRPFLSVGRRWLRGTEKKQESRIKINTQEWLHWPRAAFPLCKQPLFCSCCPDRRCPELSADTSVCRVRPILRPIAQQRKSNHFIPLIVQIYNHLSIGAASWVTVSHMKNWLLGALQGAEVTGAPRHWGWLERDSR